MAKTIGAYEAKTNLSAILEEVRRGERYTITRHGLPLALLIPITGSKDPRSAVQAIRSFRNGKKLGAAITTRDLIQEGRRR
jgi:prevent-host-death family protein